MAIDFSIQIELTSEVPGFVSEQEVKQYPGQFPEDASFQLYYDTGDTMAVKKLVVDGPGQTTVRLDAPFNPVSLTYSALSDLFSGQASGTFKKVYDVTLGKNTNGRTIHFVWELGFYGDVPNTFIQILNRLSLVQSGGGSATVTTYLNDWEYSAMYNIYATGVQNQNYPTGVQFGLTLLQLPDTLGRDNTKLVNWLLLPVQRYYSFQVVPPGTFGYNYIEPAYGSAINEREYDFTPMMNQTPTTAPLIFGVIGCALDLKRLSVYGQDYEADLKYTSPEVGDPSEPGGYNIGDDVPSFDDTSDTIGLPTDPAFTSQSIGFYNVYRCALDELVNLGDYIFGEPITDEDDIVDVMSKFVTNTFRSKLVDYIVSCHMIPVDPTYDTGPTVVSVHLGGTVCDTVHVKKVTTDYVTFDCGTISLAEYYANFADFLENCKLYLPFIGFVPARPEWFKRGSLTVKYKFNVIDGSCIAYVLSTGKYVNNGGSNGTVVGQYSGNAIVRFPITGLNYASAASGLIGSAAGMASGFASGNLLGVAGSAVNAMTAKPDIAQSNSYSATASMLGVRRPFLVIERPVSSYAENYQHELGIPANVYETLGHLSGFVKMENVHVDGISGATDQEKAEIKSLLASGVII